MEYTYPIIQIHRMKPRMIMVITAFVIFAGIGLWSLSSDTDQDAGMSPDMSACTLEALMCPDGSSVGRSGEQCTFSACPQVPYLIGELEQIGGDFQLIVETQAGERGSVVPL